MKKGLRHIQTAWPCEAGRNTDRPDEEGIKTDKMAAFGIVGGNTDRPDEEGIKTQMDPTYRRWLKHRQT